MTASATSPLLAAAAALWVCGALLGLTSGLPGRPGQAGLVVSRIISGLGGAAALATGVLILVGRATYAIRMDSGSPVGGLVVRTFPVAGLFVALLGLVAIALAWYAPRYHAAGPGTAVYLLVLDLALLACLAVLVAGGIVTFLVGWESMALLCYLLVLRHARDDQTARGAFWFLALSEVGFVLIVASLVILGVQAGSSDFSEIAAAAGGIGAGWRDAAYLLALVGFGFKAGLVPMHVWLPAAHPVAPADGSAFLSGLVVKLGIYGILLVGFVLIPDAPAWFGLVTMGLGAVSALLGILYALTEHDIKRFLAYSTIENTGIITAALGAGMTFGSYGEQTLATFLLVAALYHVANHGTYKTLLFLEAGVVEHATGTRDMDRLGGLVRRLPRSTVIIFLGTLGIAALPPLNGFVSEWLIFQGLFQGFRIPSHVIGILIVVAGGALGLTAGLAINAFVRGFGIPYLGMPRTRAAGIASEAGQPVSGPAMLATVCVGLSLGAPVVLSVLARAADGLTGVSLGPLLLPGHLTVIPGHQDFSAFSPTYLAIFLVGVLAVPILIRLAGRPLGGTAVVPVWDGGMLQYKARMQYSAMTFAAPVRVTFDRLLYRSSVRVQRASDDPAGLSGPVHYERRIMPVFEQYLYRPIVRLIEVLADLVRPIQSGDVNLYLLYVFLALLVCYLLGAL